MGLLRTVNWLTLTPPAAPPAQFQNDANEQQQNIQGRQESLFVNWRTVTYSGVVAMVQLAWIGLQAVEPRVFNRDGGRLGSA